MASSFTSKTYYAIVFTSQWPNIKFIVFFFFFFPLYICTHLQRFILYDPKESVIVFSATSLSSSRKSSSIQPDYNLVFTLEYECCTFWQHNPKQEKGSSHYYIYHTNTLRYLSSFSSLYFFFLWLIFFFSHSIFSDFLRAFTNFLYLISLLI